MDLEQLLSSADFSKSTDLKERFWKEYVLEGICGDNTIVLAEENDNYLRFRKHVFPPVELSALRLTVRSTRGDASARVYQIRAYEKTEIY